ncbi:MAG TPA: pantoate--beta-alanine ligase [Jatrophihabitantaceae bacterium]
MRVVRSRAEFVGPREALTGPVGLVPTMGALHDGHLALIEQARAFSESLIVTIFVNPMQFGPTEDLAVYPRTLEADLAMCEKAGVDLVWAPAVEDIYPGGPAQVAVDPGPLGSELEGAFRPAHFAGVLTVVAKFLGLIRPAMAFFGEKDYQQLALITRMAGDLELGVGIAGVPTVREADGLALSSRNVFLSAADRQSALALSKALFAGQAAAPGGPTAVLDAARAVLDGSPGVHVDYLELRGADLGPVPARGAARLLIAAKVGRTRLIDNVAVTL